MSKIRIILSLVLAAAGLSQAQTATDYFHRGAQYYVFGDKTNAVTQVLTGLQKFPSDEPLQALAEILRKREEQQQQQQQQQQNQDQQQDQKESQKQEEQKPQDQKDQQQESKDQQGQQKQEQQQSKAGQGDEKEQKPEERQGDQPMSAHAMTPEEAKRLLDAQKGDEKVLQFRPQGEQRQRTRKLKDW